MSQHSRQRKTAKRKRRIQRRLAPRSWPPTDRPMFTASNIDYDVADRTRGLGVGGIGVMHLLAKQSGLIKAIDQNLQLLKVHLPYHESDHVLNIAYNILSGGDCIEDIELLRNDEVYLDALGAQRIPDPTTAGDFCRRFTANDVETLQQTINDIRIKLWQQQPDSFFDEAILEADGTMAPTLGQCKQGMDISYTGQWGYHPLVVSLANTGEPLFLDNRSGNRPSYEGAAARFDQAAELVGRGGFKSILFRGDTDFTQTSELDRWDEAGDIRFIFGIDAMANLKNTAENLDKTRWNRLDRPAKYEVKTEPRVKRDNVKEQIVVKREFENIRLKSEDVAEFDYMPTKCKKTYRIVVVRKNLSKEKGEKVLFDDVRYFFYITNDRLSPADTIVFQANDRCNQENLIEQLKNGVKAMRMPVDNLTSNHAYMVMASLAWTMKAWFSLLLPEVGRWGEKHRAQKQQVLRMEFKQFVNGFIRVPCQIIRSGRKIIYRLLSWNPWQEVLLRGLDTLRGQHMQPMLC